MKFQQIMIAIAFSILTFASGLWLGTQNQRAAEPYRSKQASPGAILQGDAARLREALLQTDPLARFAEVSALLLTLGPDSLDEVRTAYDTVFLDLGETELLLLGEWWARFDPHAAMTWSESEWRADYPAVALQIIRTWARTDPVAALERANKGREDMSNSKMIYARAAIAGWEQGGKPGALEYLQSMEHGPTRQRMMRGTARRRVLRNGIDEALRWGLSLSDDDRVFKVNLIRRMISAAVRIDAEATAKWVASLQESPYFTGLPQRVAIPWVKQNKKATFAWLESLEPSGDRDDGVREAYRQWLRDDKDAAYKWLTSSENERWLDPALSMYAKSLSMGRPEDAIAVAERLIEQSLRQATLTIITRMWLAQDEEAAKDYVENSDWTEAERERALSIGEDQRAAIMARLEKQQRISAGSDQGND